MDQIKMGDSWVENSLVLAISLFIIGGIINFVIGYGLRTFRLEVSYVNDLGFLLVAYILGIFYTKKVKQIMPRGLRLKTVGLFLVFYLIVVVIFSYVTRQGNLFDLIILPAIISSFIAIIEGVIIYWFFGFAGKLYMKNSKRGDY